MIVGLTGGIGSGKSTVARLLELFGAAVFDSDTVAKKIYFFPEIKTKIIQLLGPDAYISDTQLNRPFIAAAVFANEVLLNQLNAIIHPAVGEAMKKFVSAHAGQLIVKETALLFETGLDKQVDKILLVTAPDAIRINRVMLRDKVTEKEVRLRMEKQFPQTENVKRADFIIHNDEEQLLIPQVLPIYTALIQGHVS